MYEFVSHEMDDFGEPSGRQKRKLPISSELHDGSQQQFGVHTPGRTAQEQGNDDVKSESSTEKERTKNRESMCAVWFFDGGEGIEGYGEHSQGIG
jgi:hypothetical protein